MNVLIAFQPLDLVSMNNSNAFRVVAYQFRGDVMASMTATEAKMKKVAHISHL